MSFGWALLALFAVTVSAAWPVFDVIQFGAIGDGQVSLKSRFNAFRIRFVIVDMSIRALAD